MSVRLYRPVKDRRFGGQRELGVMISPSKGPEEFGTYYLNICYVVSRFLPDS